MAECEICGRHLRTGIKYCYTCKSLGRAIGYRRKPDWEMLMFILIAATVLSFALAYWSYNKNGMTQGAVGSIFIGLFFAVMSLLVIMKQFNEIKEKNREFREKYTDSEWDNRRIASNNAIKVAFIPTLLLVFGFITGVFYFITKSFSFLTLKIAIAIFVISLFITLFIVIQIGDNAKKRFLH